MSERKPCRWKPAPRFSASWEINHKGHKGTRRKARFENRSTLVTSCSFIRRLYCELTSKTKRNTKIKLRAPSCPLWLKRFTLACRANLRRTISHGFPAAEQPAVAPELLRAVAPIDALPAAVAVPTADAPEQVEACIDVPAAVAVAA